MENRLLRAPQTLDRLRDQLLATGRQDLQPHILRHGPRRGDKTLREVEVRGAGGGVGDLDFFVAQLAQHLEVAPLLLAVHWVHEGLVAVAQVGG